MKNHKTKKTINHLNKEQKTLQKNLTREFAFLFETETLFSRLKKHFTSNKPKYKGIYIHGPVGRGKTMLVNYLMTKISRPKLQIHLQNFMKEIHEKLHKLRMNKPQDNSEILAQIAKEYESYQVIYLDEFEVHDIADAMVLAKLFREFLKLEIIIIITSNFEPKNLYQDGLQRSAFIPFIDMVYNDFFIGNLSGKIDYRKNLVKKPAQLIFENDKKAIKEISNFLNNALGELHFHNIELELYGRKYKFQKVFKNCLWTNVDELLLRPFSANDYINIVSKFDIIVLSNIIIMNDDDINQVIRFINFIDQAYNAKLLLLAELKCDFSSLYQGHKKHQEIARAISRLNEMNSVDYFNNSKYSGLRLN